MALALCVAIAARGQSQIYELATPIGGFRLLNPDGSATDTVGIAPVGTHFRIVSGDADNGKSIDVIFTYVPPANVVATQRVAAERAGISPGEEAFATRRPQIVTSKDKRRWRVGKDVLLANYYVLFSGRDGGVLAVPFKFQLSDSKLTAGGTLGGYVGYHVRSVTPLVSAGIAFVSTAGPSLASGQSSPPDTKVGFTVATGAVVDWIPAVQLGAIIGWDLGIDKAQYMYANKTWISVSIGTGFTKH